MKNLMTIAKKNSLRAALILPLAGFAAFTGCSSIGGNAGNQPVVKARVATFMQQTLEKPASTTADSDEDPGYEWFY